MTHKLFQDLTPLEQRHYVGSLVIAVQQSEFLFAKGEEIIQLAETIGIYNKVKVNTNGTEVENNLLQ